MIICRSKGIMLYLPLLLASSTIGTGTIKSNTMLSANIIRGINYSSFLSIISIASVMRVDKDGSSLPPIPMVHVKLTFDAANSNYQQLSTLRQGWGGWGWGWGWCIPHEFASCIGILVLLLHLQGDPSVQLQSSETSLVLIL